MNEIMNLRHRHGLPLTRPAVTLGEERKPDTRERRISKMTSVVESSDNNVM